MQELNLRHIQMQLIILLQLIQKNLEQVLQSCTNMELI